jgi:serine/threonine protein phosphatase 1
MKKALGAIPHGSKIIFLGDYVDRGPKSARVVSRIRLGISAGLPWVALKGNHEDMVAQCFKDNEYVGDQSYWMPNGGSTTYHSYDGNMDSMGSDATWLDKLPLYHQDQHRIYVHGYADPIEEDPEKFNSGIILWDRYDKTEDYGWFGKHVVHGHTPRNGGEFKFNRTNLDGGAVWTGELLVGVFDDDTPGGPVEIMKIKVDK